MKFLIVLLALTNIAVAEKQKYLPQSLNIETKQYSLCKEHIIRYAYVIKIAYVGLYLQNCVNDHNEDLLEVSDKMIRFNYQVDVKASVFKESAEKFFKKNMRQSLGQQDIQELDRFNQLYENIKASEYYDLYHQKGQKLKLFKNNKLLGISENINFASQYFNIWFGKYPAVKPLKKSFFKK